MNPETLQTIWFVLLFVLLGAYAVLDGIDTGVGILRLFTCGERERHASLKAIGPVWDGHEIWLLACGLAFYDAFPRAYQAVLPAFRLPVLVLVVALVARAAAMVLRSLVNVKLWKGFWDAIILLGGLIVPFIIGGVLGNLFRGLPMNVNTQVFHGRLQDLANPYALVVGFLTLIAFILHGGLYLAYKSQGALRERLAGILPVLWLIFLVVFVATGAATYRFTPSLIDGALDGWAVYAAMFLTLIGIVAMWPLMRSEQFGAAVFASGLTILGILGLGASGLYPRLVPLLTDPQLFAWKIQDSSAEPTKLNLMLLIAVIGIPVALAYTIFIHWAIKHKVVVMGEEV